MGGGRRGNRVASFLNQSLCVEVGTRADACVGFEGGCASGCLIEDAEGVVRRLDAEDFAMGVVVVKVSEGELLRETEDDEEEEE